MSKLGLSCVWTVKERRSGIWVPVLRVKNIFTNTGLNALASAIQGAYVAPNFLVIDSAGAKLQNAYAPGATSIDTDVRVDLPGDTQLVLSPGTGQQETVTFTSVTGSGPYTYALSAPTANTHGVNDYALRVPRVTDDMSSVISEQQYDATNAPGQRMPAASGYNNGAIGEWTIQFYFTGAQAPVHFNTLGLADSSDIGAGSLHNHFILGYDHTTSGNDVEIDGSITIANL